MATRPPRSYESHRKPRRGPWSVLLCFAGILCFIGIAAALCGRFIPGVVDSTLAAGIKSKTVWQPNSSAEDDERFRSNTSPTAPPDYVRFWLFNLTNAEEVQAGAKPHLVEVGPFTYIKTRIKLDVWWNREGHVAFKEYSYHTFVPELSGASLSSRVVTLNLPLLGVVAAINAQLPDRAKIWMDLLLAVIESQSKRDSKLSPVFSARMARELLWGYQDPLLEALALLEPGAVPSSRFQLVKNMTGPDGALSRPHTVVDTGLYNSSNTWNMLADFGVQAVTSWACGPERVRGTDAFQFPPGLPADSALTVWVGELFRAARLLPVGTRQLFGVNLRRYEPDPAQGAPDKCHFQNVKGLMNVSSPTAGGALGRPGKPGASVFLSLPHFCDADPLLAGALSGVECNRSRHVTFLDVEPITGITMAAQKRLMMSSQGGEAARHLVPALDPALVLPVFWAQESSEVTPELALKFRQSVYGAQALSAGLRKYCTPVGVAMALAGALLLAGMLWAGASTATPRVERWRRDVEGDGDYDSGDEGGGGVCRGPGSEDDNLGAAPSEDLNAPLLGNGPTDIFSVDVGELSSDLSEGSTASPPPYVMQYSQPV